MRSVFLCLLLLLGFSSCRLFQAHVPEQWEEAKIDTQNQKVLFEGIVLALGQEGFRVGTGAQPGKGVVRTAWRVNASPFKGKGWRERATVTFAQGEEGKSVVRARVHRETNESLRPLLEGSAKWKRTDDQVNVSLRILEYLHAYLDFDMPQ